MHGNGNVGNERAAWNLMDPTNVSFPSSSRLIQSLSPFSRPRIAATLFRRELGVREHNQNNSSCWCLIFVTLFHVTLFGKGVKVRVNTLNRSLYTASFNGLLPLFREKTDRPANIAGEASN